MVWTDPSYMELTACLEDAVEFLGELVESESYTLFSSGFDIRGKYKPVCDLQRFWIKRVVRLLKECNSLAHREQRRCACLGSPESRTAGTLLGCDRQNPTYAGGECHITW